MKSLINTIKEHVNAPRNDDYLHFSSDLQNPRHTCISWVHGYPIVDKPWMNTFPLLQGTAIHEYIHEILDDSSEWIYSPEQEIVLEDRDFPWKGTVDAYLTNPEGESWLVDYKTASGVSLSFMEDVKPDHLLQVSAYYHFGAKIPNMRVGVLYLPSSPDYKRRWEEPRFYEVRPLYEEVINLRMSFIENAISNYVADGVLPAPLEGEYSWKHNKRNKNWEKWYKPHYSSLYCPWKSLDDDPCGCSTQKPYIVETSDEDPNADVCS